MALVGLFLVMFLLVHLGLNLTVLILEGDREIFNKAAHFMGTNLIVKIVEVGLFGFLIVHIIIGIVLQLQNWGALGQKDTRKEPLHNYRFFAIHDSYRSIDFHFPDNPFQ